MSQINLTGNQKGKVAWVVDSCIGGFEPPFLAPKARVIPLDYIRSNHYTKLATKVTNFCWAKATWIGEFGATKQTVDKVANEHDGPWFRKGKISGAKTIGTRSAQVPSFAFFLFLHVTSKQFTLMFQKFQHRKDVFRKSFEFFSVTI